MTNRGHHEDASATTVNVIWKREKMRMCGCRRGGEVVSRRKGESQHFIVVQSDQGRLRTLQVATLFTCFVGRHACAMWMHNATTILGRWRLVKQKTFGGKIWSILFQVLFIGTTKVATHGGLVLSI